jgi:CHAT domain-containing protein
MASTEQPREARTWSDLSVALLEKALREDNAELVIEALTAADRAVGLDAKLPEALFNRAMALEAIGLGPVAVRAFKHYIDLDPSSPWTDEARTHISSRKKTAALRWDAAVGSLEQSAGDGHQSQVLAIVKRFPQETRTWGEAEYLARWAEAVERHDEPGAKRWIIVAQHMGDALQAFSGESLLKDATAVAAAARGDRLAHLTRAHLIYRQARILYGQRKVAEAGPQFESAAREFASSGSPMTKVVDYYLANVAYDRSDAAGCLKRLAAVDERTPVVYSALKAEIQWTRASAFARLNRLYESVEALRSALSLFERLGERDNLTSVQSSTAGVLSHLGQDFEAWKLRRIVFQAASDSGRAYVLELAIASAARTSVRRGRSDVARALLSAQLELPADSSRVRFDAVLWHAFAVVRGDNRPFTVAEREAIVRAASAISDPDLRRDALDESRLADATALREYDPARALALLDATLAERLSRHRSIEVPRIMLERARSLRDMGRRSEAATAFQQSINLIEEQQASIPQLDLRDSFLGSADAAFTELAELLFADHDIADGFNAVERARGRAITERLAIGDHLLPVSLECVASRLAQGVALVEWVVVRNRTWAVMVTRNGWRWAGIQSPEADLRQRAAHLREAIESGDDVAANRDGQALYSILFAHVLRSQERFETLVIVPDPAMDSIPFASLRDPATGRLLIEDVAILNAPSATVYLTSRDRTPASQGTPRTAVLAGDPEIALMQFGSLPRLPEAANEIRMISRMYPEAFARTGLTASRQWFMQKSVSSDVVHVAAHTVLNTEVPWFSVLPLAADSSSDGLLYVRDVANMRFQRSPIVVLAGCKTGAAVSPHAALHNLALAFLAAGARSVVGTLWDVDDRVARVFSLTLHRQLSRGIRPAVALRETQLNMLRSTDPVLRSPKSWSGFQLYGSEK